MIIMDSKAQLTVDVISKVTQGRMSVINAAKLLNKSGRTIERYLQRYQQVGIQFIVHRKHVRRLMILMDIRARVETFQRCFPQNSGKFCTLINNYRLQEMVFDSEI
jgi:predicted DNA-binding transcriptional regulator YafY